jgi:hypothetical protein
MSVTIDGTTGITSTGGYTGDGISFADGTPSNTLVTTTGGNVGVGTSFIPQKFSLANNTSIGWVNAAGNNSDQIIYADVSSNLNFYTGATYRARIDSSGNLLVGTTATVNAAKSVFSFSSSNNGVYLVDSTGVSGAQFMRFDSTSNTCGQITRVGATSAVLYNTSSDYRLKENPTPLTGALERVAALKPVQWVWKDCDGAVGEGFIAHEVQEIIPSAVTGEKDAVDADGKPQYQGMDASYLVATLTAAIQEQQAIIEQLRADVETLKAKP